MTGTFGAADDGSTSAMNQPVTWRFLRSLLAAVSIAGVLSLLLSVRADEPAPLFSQDGYRIAEFLAPVPPSLAGAVTVGTDTVRSLVAEGDLVLIDVLPAPPKPDGLPPTALWMPPERRNLPGSVWLPNVGYGRLSDELESYFRDSLERLTGGDPGKKIVIYCLADCWMSWNAARRAIRYGYSGIHWYPEGTTGWDAAGLPVAKATPAPHPQSR